MNYVNIYISITNIRHTLYIYTLYKRIYIFVNIFIHIQYHVAEF